MACYTFLVASWILCFPLFFVASPVPDRDGYTKMEEYASETNTLTEDYVIPEDITHLRFNVSAAKHLDEFTTFKPCSSSAMEVNLGSTYCRATILMDYQSNRIPLHFPIVKCLNSSPTPQFLRNSNIRCEEVRYNIQMLYEEYAQDKSIIYKPKLTSITAGCVESISPSLIVEKKPGYVILSEEQQMPEYLSTVSLAKYQSDFFTFKPCSVSAMEVNLGSTYCRATILMDYQPNRIPRRFPIVKCLNSLSASRFLRRRNTRCTEVGYNISMLYKEYAHDKGIIYTSRLTPVIAGCVESTLPSLYIEKKPNIVSISTTD